MHQFFLVPAGRLCVKPFFQAVKLNYFYLACGLGVTLPLKLPFGHLGVYKPSCAKFDKTRCVNNHQKSDKVWEQFGDKRTYPCISIEIEFQTLQSLVSKLSHAGWSLSTVHYMFLGTWEIQTTRWFNQIRSESNLLCTFVSRLDASCPWLEQSLRSLSRASLARDSIDGFWLLAVAWWVPHPSNLGEATSAKILAVRVTITWLTVELIQSVYVGLTHKLGAIEVPSPGWSVTQSERLTWTITSVWFNHHSPSFGHQLTVIYAFFIISPFLTSIQHDQPSLPSSYRIGSSVPEIDG